jgi:hypothetical protein
LNLFADMGNVQPQVQSLKKGLVKATNSNDNTPPKSQLLSIQKHEDTVISGKASDVGGIVAGIEVSTDQGATWHPADLSEDGKSFSYTVKDAMKNGININMSLVKSRAVDDSGNLEIVNI